MGSQLKHGRYESQELEIWRLGGMCRDLSRSSKYEDCNLLLPGSNMAFHWVERDNTGKIVDGTGTKKVDDRVRVWDSSINSTSGSHFWLSPTRGDTPATF
jgi:hypothetical protein